MAQRGYGSQKLAERPKRQFAHPDRERARGYRNHPGSAALARSNEADSGETGGEQEEERSEGAATHADRMTFT
jgi:hypothetical protein